MAHDSSAALARAVLIHGPLSRGALTTRLGLSPASLTRLAKPLLDAGTLVELDVVAPGGLGRPTRPLDVSPALGRFVGVKLTGDRLYAVATDSRARILAGSEHELDDTRPAAVIERIVAAVTEIAGPRAAEVGVSIGGFVHDGVVHRAPFLGWTGVGLGVALTERLGLPVTVENDVVALTEAERWFGLGRDTDGFAVVTIGTGVGYALVVNGEAVPVADGRVGSGGHVPLSAGGPLCTEGHRGCAQAMLSSGSIAAQVSEALGRTVDHPQALALAAAGDAAARAVVDAAGDALGRFLALATAFTLQSAIVLAGDGIALYPLVAERVEAVLTAERDPDADPVTIHVDDSGFLAWARGAAVVAIQTAMRRVTATD